MNNKTMLNGLNETKTTSATKNKLINNSQQVFNGAASNNSSSSRGTNNKNSTIGLTGGTSNLKWKVKCFITSPNLNTINSLNWESSSSGSLKPMRKENDQVVTIFSNRTNFGTKTNSNNNRINTSSGNSLKDMETLKRKMCLAKEWSPEKIIPPSVVSALWSCTHHPVVAVKFNSSDKDELHYYCRQKQSWLGRRDKKVWIMWSFKLTTFWLQMPAT